MKKITFKRLIKMSLFVLLMMLSAIFIHYYRYRFTPLVNIGSVDQIVIEPLEVYTNKLSYQVGDSLFIYIKSKETGQGTINKTIQQNKFPIQTFDFNIQEQQINYTQSEKGCSWDISDTIIISEEFQPGYYSVDLETGNHKTTFNFVIENRKKSKIAVLAPLSTWVAYNNWGGKSLYVNNIEDKTTYYTSSKRPNPNNDIRVEANSTNYFLTNYNSILLPDYSLEYDLELLKQVDVIVLNYHAEYFSELMYNNLVTLLEDYNISLISLGANQMYWKTYWHDNYAYMECRKDLTSFDNHILNYGGMWRHHINKSEHNILGVQFTEEGMHSYAPYEVKNSTHWIYDNTNVKSGDLFGLYGIDSLPISGDETDKITASSNDITLLAKGLNCTSKNPYKNLNDNCSNNAGADFIIKTNPNYSVLSTGSIQSGSGLGNDKVFTTMINNFIHHEIDK